MTMAIRIDRLGRRAAQVEADEAVVVDLVDQDRRRLAGPAGRGNRMDDAEGVEEGVDHVDHQQEEGGRRQQREDDGPEALDRPGAVDGRGLDQRSRDRLQAGQEEEEVVAETCFQAAAMMTRIMASPPFSLWFQS